MTLWTSSLLLLALGLAAMAGGVMLGPLMLPPERVLAVLGQALGGSWGNVATYEWATVVHIRVPRVLTAALVGAALACSGAVLQGLTRNPLVEPGLIGVSSGAAVGAAAVIVLGGAMLWLPLAAFSGAMLVTLSVMLVARVHGQESTSTLLLAGVAVNALAAAILGVLTVAADDPALRTLTFWMFGSLARSGQAELLILALIIVPGTVMMWRYAGFLDAMALGEGGAAHLGYAVRRDRWILVALVALAVGVAVAFSGIIGFVGLVVPHLARLLFGAAHRQLLPISAALGAILLMLVDTISRLVLMPAEVPVGVITALVGAPLFIGLLIWRARMSEAFA